MITFLPKCKWLSAGDSFWEWGLGAARPWQLLFPQMTITGGKCSLKIKSLLSIKQTPFRFRKYLSLAWPSTDKGSQGIGKGMWGVCVCVCVCVYDAHYTFSPNNCYEGGWKAKETHSRWPTEAMERALVWVSKSWAQCPPENKLTSESSGGLFPVNQPRFPCNSPLVSRSKALGTIHTSWMGAPDVKQGTPWLFANDSAS